MTDKTKRIGLVALGAVVCVVLVVVIAGRFSSSQATHPALDSAEPSKTEPQANIETPELSIQIADGSDTKAADPGAGADSIGTEQTIQADTIKPESPEPPTPTEKNHDNEDISEEERNTETPPTYEPEQTTVTTPSTEPKAGTTNSQGQMYVPGFGYVDVGSGNDGGSLGNMYESGEKVGTMD